jgi:hypothetical protein
MGKNLRLTLYERLAASGAIRPGRGRALGVFPTRTWPAQDAQHEQQVRQLVTQALVQQTAPDGRTAALIALLHALRCEHKIIDPQPYHLSRRQLSARAAEIAAQLGIRGRAQGDPRYEQRGRGRGLGTVSRGGRPAGSP